MEVSRKKRNTTKVLVLVLEEEGWNASCEEKHWKDEQVFEKGMISGSLAVVEWTKTGIGIIKGDWKWYWTPEPCTWHRAIME